MHPRSATDRKTLEAQARLELTLQRPLHVVSPLLPHRRLLGLGAASPRPRLRPPLRGQPAEAEPLRSSNDLSDPWSQMAVAVVAMRSGLSVRVAGRESHQVQMSQPHAPFRSDLIRQMADLRRYATQR